MRDLHPCPPCGRQGRPGQGFLAGFIERPRGSAPRERDHRGGDHPVPSRTRQLSPPSPRVLQREAAGGQGVALAEGAFLSAPREARGVMLPLRPFSCVGRHCPAGCRDRRRGLPSWPVDCTGAPQARLGLRGDSSRVFYLDLRVAFALLVFVAPFHLLYCCVLSLAFVGVFLFSGCWPSFW